MNVPSGRRDDGPLEFSVRGLDAEPVGSPGSTAIVHAAQGSWVGSESEVCDVAAFCSISTITFPSIDFNLSPEAGLAQGRGDAGDSCGVGVQSLAKTKIELP